MTSENNNINEPTSKAPALDLFISQVMGKSREIQIASNLCMSCDKDPIAEFKSDFTMIEYRISGMCQDCQDKTYKVEDDTDKDEEDTEPDMDFLPGYGERA